VGRPPAAAQGPGEPGGAAFCSPGLTGLACAATHQRWPSTGTRRWAHPACPLRICRTLGHQNQSCPRAARAPHRTAAGVAVTGRRGRGRRRQRRPPPCARPGCQGSCAAPCSPGCQGEWKAQAYPALLVVTRLVVHVLVERALRRDLRLHGFELPLGGWLLRGACACPACSAAPSQARSSWCRHRRCLRSAGQCSRRPTSGRSPPKQCRLLLARCRLLHGQLCCNLMRWTAPLMHCGCCVAPAARKQPTPRGSPEQRARWNAAQQTNPALGPQAAAAAPIAR